MEVLLDGLPLDRISTSMTINSPAAPIWAMYIAAAERRGFPQAMLEGTTQNDILKEFVAQKEFLFPPEPSMRLVTDTIEFGTRELPRWNTISISGYHIREAGSTAVQELAFTIADGMAYVEDGPATRPARRRVRAAPVVLLQLPQRVLRGDREIPGRAPDLVEAHDGAIPRRERAIDLDAIPHADGRRVADRAAAVEQPDPRGRAGTRRRPRRNAVAPHRRVRRGVGRAVGRGGAPGAPPAADPRRGDRSRLDGRSAWRLMVRRVAHERDRTRRLAVPRRDRHARRDGRGDRGGLSAARDRGRRLPVPARGRRR